MLREIANTRQIKGEPHRRWFTSGTMDLVVWCRDDGTLVGFQLCYDKDSAERALTWHTDSGFSHMIVDDGDNAGGMRYKSAPILAAGGEFDPVRILDLFNTDSRALPRQLAAFVRARLEERLQEA
ncbi:MAG TPA: hypothetical protein VEC35_14195 [Noviherbaspirillum sp.]|nr:hypothetical protein [Noviherbaspirillum sp.]